MAWIYWSAAPTGGADQWSAPTKGVPTTEVVGSPNERSDPLLLLLSDLSVAPSNVSVAGRVGCAGA
jgi:hypothetical protein